MGFIYKITNKINGKIYIGQTIGSITKRWREHKCESIFCNSPYILHRAIRKYKENNFSIEQLEECDNSLLDEREIYYISLFNSYVDNPNSNGYNMTNGGRRNPIKIPYEKIYLEWDNGHSIKEIGEITGYNRNTIKKILEGCPSYSIMESEKRSHILSGKSRSKRIIQLDKNYQIITVYNSVTEAEKNTGINHSAIINVANHKKGHHTAGKYYWEYEENYDKNIL